MSQPADLRTVLDIDDADLTANRDGKLSPRQNERLRATRRRNLRVGAGLVLALVVISSGLLYLAATQQSLILNLVGVGVTLCNAALLGVNVRGILRLSSDIDKGEVQTLTGRVKHTIRVTGRVATYIVHVDKQDLVLSKPIFFALREGQRYRLYRAPESRVLLAGEPF